MENALQRAVETWEYKQPMGQQKNEGLFRDGRTFTDLVYDLYPKIGQTTKGLGLTYSGKEICFPE